MLLDVMQIQLENMDLFTGEWKLESGSFCLGSYFIHTNETSMLREKCQLLLQVERNLMTQITHCGKFHWFFYFKKILCIFVVLYFKLKHLNCWWGWMKRMASNASAYISYMMWRNHWCLELALALVPSRKVIWLINWIQIWFIKLIQSCI